MGKRLLPLVVVILAVALAAPASAEHKVKLADLIKEIQQQGSKGDDLSLVWWMPVEFWQASMAANDAPGSPQQVEQFVSVIRPYLMVAAIDGKLGPLGGPTFVSEQALRAQIKVVDSNGRSYLPLADDKINADVKNLFQIMRPIFINIMGPMGENMRFFLFPARDADGKEIASATSQGGFDILMGDRRFHWRLPLGSLLAPKVCPEDGEALNGSWSFCPWHGTKLKTQEAPPPAAAKPPKPDPSGR
jgi:hypothetical protein